MSWFRKKGPTEKEVEAFQLGREMGGKIATAFQVYQDKRFGPVYQAYLDLFRGQLQDVIKNEKNHPPLILMKAEVETFEKEVATLQTEMAKETKSSMSEWFDRARQMGVDDFIEEQVQKSIEDFCQRLKNDAGRMMEQYLPVVSDADAAWQKAFPEKANYYYGTKND